jgi:hypothetical protein
MPRRPSTFCQADMSRAAQAAQTAGLTTGEAEVALDGTIRVIVAKALELSPANSLDQRKPRTARAAHRAQPASRGGNPVCARSQPRVPVDRVRLTQAETARTGTERSRLNFQLPECGPGTL